MILKRIQTALQTLYNLSIPYNIEQFVLKKRREGVLSIKDRWCREAFLIHQKENQFEIGLYIEPDILKDLRKQNPFRTLTVSNLDPFLVATEGVSHFLYFLTRAQKDLKLTQLEMEIQAEIDKYLLTLFLYQSQYQTFPHFLLQHLFDRWLFAKHLNEEEKRRYIEANHFARKYCSHWEEEYLKYRRWKECLESAREFYSFNHWEKIRHLTP